MQSKFFTLALLSGALLFCVPTQVTGQCFLSCNDEIQVHVPPNGTYEIKPFDLSGFDPALLCPDGIFHAQILESNIWVPATGGFVFDQSHIGQTFIGRLYDEVTQAACLVNVSVVESPDTVHFQLCSELWKDNRPMRGTTLIFQPNNPSFPYSPITFVLDSNQNCVDVSVAVADYLPGTTFSYTGIMPNTDHDNGVSSVDLCQIARHILGIAPLSPFYSIFAADANRSSSITTFDIVESRKLIAGIYDELPNNTSWWMMPDYCQFPNPNNPFQSTCPSEISLTQLTALNGGMARVIGVKICDVDGDVALNGDAYLPPVVNDSVTLLLPEGPIAANVPVVAPIKFDVPFTLSSLQVHFFLDPNVAQLDSITSGALDISTGSYHYDATTGDLILFDVNLPSISIPVGEWLFYLHFKVSGNTNFENVLSVAPNDSAPFTIVTGQECGNFYKVIPMYASIVSTHTAELRGARIAAPSPNPFSEQTFLEIELENAETALLEVLDLQGRVVFSEEKALSAGVSRWGIHTKAMTSGSLSIWRLNIAGQTVSGKLLRL